MIKSHIAKSVTYTTGLFLLASIAVLWSWNTLAELLALPSVQYKHALASLLMLLVLRWIIRPAHRGHRQDQGGEHEYTPR